HLQESRRKCGTSELIRNIRKTIGCHCIGVAGANMAFRQTAMIVNEAATTDSHRNGIVQRTRCRVAVSSRSPRHQRLESTDRLLRVDRQGYRSTSARRQHSASVGPARWVLAARGTRWI